jgi:DNA-binding NarL/FixJ family response regulator
MALTRRERDVLVAMANGRRNREIATELFISLHTVTHHVSRIYAKLGVETRSQAVIFAYRAGLVDPRLPQD